VKRIFLTLSLALVLGWIFRPQPAQTHEVVSTTVTYDREIVRIIKKKCIVCHSDNNLSVPLTTYEQTRPWARAIEEEVLRRHMPPWRSVAGYGQFANDNALSGRELQFIVSWVEGNGPKTKDQTLIVNFDQNKSNPNEKLQLDSTRWTLGNPDAQVMLAANAIPAGQGDEIRRVTVDLGLTADRHIRALEYKPGDRRVVRAAFFSVEETRQWLGSWTPWYGVTSLPQDVGYSVPAGSHVTAEIHYRRASQAVEDRGTLGVYFAPKPPVHSPADFSVALNNDGSATAQGQKFTGALTIPADINVLSFKPDVQPGVEAIEVNAKKPDGTVQVVLLIRNVLADWPTPYIPKDPITLRKGTELGVTYYVKPDATPAPTNLKLTLSAYAAGGGPTSTR